MTKFTDLGLAAPLLKALDAQGYSTPTPIQAKAIPCVLTGTDLLGIAQTGTGKTAAFALPILHHLSTTPSPAPRGGCRVLVLSPTRELASQIADSFRDYGRNLNLSVSTIFGGVAPRPQIRALSRGIDILIATPGRLLDHMQSGHANLANTEILVLDEADQMLDLGFVRPIRTIVAGISGAHQTLFFSATMPREITKLANEFLDDPVKVTVTPVSSTVERISQRVIFVETSKKRALLGELLDQSELSRTLIFTRTKRGADKVAKHLDARGISVSAIHGNKSQRQREQALNAFRKDKIQVLVATDIAARGIDIDAVSHVINYELPEVPEAYVHRIGRTARAGASGSAISLCDGGERHLLRAIERLTKQSIPNEDRRKDKELEIEKAEPRQRGARAPHGGRSSHGSRVNERSGRGRSSGGRPETRRGSNQEETRRGSNQEETRRGSSQDQRPGRARNDERQGGDERRGSGNRRNARGFDPLQGRGEQLNGKTTETGEGDRRSQPRPDRRRSAGRQEERHDSGRTERADTAPSGSRNKRTGTKARKHNPQRNDGANKYRSDNGRTATGGKSPNATGGNGAKPKTNRNKTKRAKSNSRSGQRLEPA